MKKISKIIILLIIPIFSISCIVDDENETGFDTSPYTLGFEKSSTLESYFEDIGPVEINVGVNVLGGNSGIPITEDVTVNYSVDPSSTATEGNEFSLSGNSFVISNGLTFGNLPITINTGALNPDQPTTLVLKLNSTTSQNAQISSISDTFSITFVGCQSNHAGNYTSTAVISNTAPNTVVFELAPNTYRIESMPYLAFGGAGGSPAYIDFTDVCGVLTATGWVGGSGLDSDITINENGDITFEYLTVYNGSDASTGVWFDLPAATYIKIN